jgi:autotransporter strand-loop-strand O-heptosyltransferase
MFIQTQRDMFKYNLHHVKGLYFELTQDDNKEKEYDVTIIDRTSKELLYRTNLKKGGWIRLNRKFLSDINITIKHDDKIIEEINFLEKIKNKRVFISFDSGALGDTIAWIPYCLEFARYYQCKVIVSTFMNHLFEKSYPELEFVDRGVVVSDIIAMFDLGWFWEKEREPVNPILIPLQKSASNILNLPYREIVPIIDFKPQERPIEGKYVCISIFSTSQCKLWYYWQDVIDFLIGQGYKVIEVSKQNDMMGQKTSDLKGLIELEDKSMQNTINTIYHSDFFIGLSSGLSWLSYALRKKVYLIANFSNKEHEFTINTVRIYDESTCNSCWNNPIFKFDKGNWNWCPEHEDTPRHFECHKLITSDKVIKAIKENEGI